ncbi:PREDICTED: fibrinogen-like protein A [Amphimedon queenslandica]|uniref:Fibrinogen C-terminal domain-containing protein n=1 Tax=Amphimedon queenslandica TaxID=400682 RepID=A0A1X7V8T6_AMPQE|nr:PREDICTED: fibrinogen-like protein A [Amphimedon queenslandica]|eukprot:XP_003385432.1 PREDICTED: fibrinogen-like protein A [Amphimedon queenslandica]
MSSFIHNKPVLIVACLALVNIGLVSGNCPDDTTSSPLPSHTSSESTTNIASGTPSPSLTVQSAAVPTVGESSTVSPSVAVTTSIAAVVTPSPTPTPPWVNGIPDPPSTQVNAQPVCFAPPDCKTWLEMGANESKVYPISPDGTNVVLVYCDMETDGGGWTVLLRRQDGSVEFHRNLAQYESGFGDLTGEHWLGNVKMHQLTNQGGTYTLRVEIAFRYKYPGVKQYAKYSRFSIGDSNSAYQLSLSGYSGTGFDALTGHNGLRFSTYDRDLDTWGGVHCASNRNNGGWWYHGCYHANLTGRYGTHQYGFDWMSSRDPKAGPQFDELKFAEMKMRRN